MKKRVIIVVKSIFPNFRTLRHVYDWDRRLDNGSKFRSRSEFWRGCAKNNLQLLEISQKWSFLVDFLVFFGFFVVFDPLDRSRIEIKSSIVAQNFGRDLYFDVVVLKITHNLLKLVQNGHFWSFFWYFRVFCKKVDFWGLGPHKVDQTSSTTSKYRGFGVRIFNKKSGTRVCGLTDPFRYFYRRSLKYSN